MDENFGNSQSYSLKSKIFSSHDKTSSRTCASNATLTTDIVAEAAILRSGIQTSRPSSSRSCPDEKDQAKADADQPAARGSVPLQELRS